MKFRDKPCACEQPSAAAEQSEADEAHSGDLTPAAGGILANA
jgi:hypothetical protein